MVLCPHILFHFSKCSYSSIVTLRYLLFIVSCVFKYGASRVFRWFSLFVVAPRMLTCSWVIHPSNLVKCTFTGPFLKLNYALQIDFVDVG